MSYFQFNFGTTMPRRALLVVNRDSRNGANDINSALARFALRGIDILEIPLENPAQLPQLIRRHRDEVDCVVIGGGDGSMNAAAEALLDTGLPLGLLPMGTANDLARTLKIPTDLEQAADVIGGGLRHAIDLARVNGRCFFNVANIGLGVDVTHHLSSDMKQRWGALSYARSLLKALKARRSFHADIECDGRRKRVRSIQIAVGNGRHYGGGMTVSERASIDDHLFFLYSIEPRPWYELLRFAPAFRAGRFEARAPADVDQGKHITIHTRRPMTVTADGEIVTRTPASFDMLAGAIQVFVPESYFNDQPHRQEVPHAAQG
jgi:YegS/Rv2252/BmrU family lipid kinase